jgi:hypothetical protein
MAPGRGDLLGSKYYEARDGIGGGWWFDLVGGDGLWRDQRRLRFGAVCERLGRFDEQHRFHGDRDWSASEVECLASCPGTAPDIGSPCETEETPGPCPVENACGMTEVYCVEGEWSLYPPGSDGSDRAPRPPDGAGGSSDIIVQPLCPEGAPTLYTACCPLTTPDYCDYRPGGSSDLLPPNTVGSTTGAQGSGGASGSASTTGGTGGTGGTGAFGLCLTCDRTQLVWVASNACP